MKKLLSWLIPAIILFSSCSKSGSTSGNGNGGGNGGGGGNNNNPTITSITPVNPYPDDQFTINGTGFNPDATKDTVELGRMVNGKFGAWHDGPPPDMPSLVQVVSATSTSLVVKAVNFNAVDLYSFPNSTSQSIAVMQVRTGTKAAVTPVIPFNRLLQLNYMNDYNNGTTIARPNDSLTIGGKGFSKTGLILKIGGIQVTSFKVDSMPYNGQLTLRLPKLFFGEVNDQTLQEVKTMSVTKLDGHTVQKDFNFYLSPLMKITGMFTENSSYSLSGLNGSGGIIKVFVNGSCLKNDAIVKVDGGIPASHSQMVLPVSGFQDNVTLEVGPGGMSTGSYNVSIWRGSTIYGACSFTMTP